MAALLTPEQFEAFGDLPTRLPPPGVEANFVDPYDLVCINYAIMALALVLPAIVVALRLYTKAVIMRKLGSDDYVLVLGWILYIVYTTFISLLVRDHIGRHQWNVQLKDTPAILYHLRVASVFYVLATTLVKTSILLQYLKLFSVQGVRDFMFWSCWGLIGFQMAFYLAAIICDIFACTPVKKFWNPLTVAGHCVNYLAINVVAGVVNVATDVAIIALPQRAIWRLQMTTARKIRASCIFLIGLFALAASVVRLYYSVVLLRSDDGTWYTNLMGVWTHAECITTIVCSCLPALAKLASTWMPSICAFSKNVSRFGRSSRIRSANTNGQTLGSRDGKKQLHYVATTESASTVAMSEIPSCLKQKLWTRIEEVV